MLPDHFCGKEGAFSRDAQIPWLLSVSPSYRQLCGMKAMGSRLGAVVLSNSLTEGLLIFVRRSWPKACSFLQTHPKEPLASDSKSGLELQPSEPPHGLSWAATNVQDHSGNVGEAEALRISPNVQVEMEGCHRTQGNHPGALRKGLDSFQRLFYFSSTNHFAFLGVLR